MNANYQPRDINQTLQAIFGLKNAGKNPQQILQMLIQQNPQAQAMFQILQNMAQGRTPKEFIMQMAKQNGVNEQNIQMLSQML